MLRIGLFSRITQTSVGQLRYYDDIGLLKPAHTDPFTGYRYYELDQLQSLNRILALKGLGLPLEDIARLVNQETAPGEILSLLLQQKAQIKQTLQENIERLNRVEQHLERLDEYGELPQYDIVFKPVDKQPCLSTRQAIPNRASLGEVVQQMQQAVERLYPQRSLRCFAVYHQQEWEAGVILQAAQKKIRLPSLLPLNPRELPAESLMATAVCRGNWQQVEAACESISQWVDLHDYRVTGPHREVYLRLHPEQPNINLTEIQFPVTRLH